MSDKKSGRSFQFWTAEEDSKLKTLIDQNKTHEDIAKALNRTNASVLTRCQKLAILELKEGKEQEISHSLDFKEQVLKKYNVKEDRLKKVQTKLCIHKQCIQGISKKSNTGNYCKDHLTAEMSERELIIQLSLRIKALEDRVTKLEKSE
jgi:hypothetical protein